MRVVAKQLPVVVLPSHSVFRLLSDIVKHKLVMSTTSRRHLPSPFA